MTLNPLVHNYALFLLSSFYIFNIKNYDYIRSKILLI